MTGAAVIIASHSPFNDKVLYASRLLPHRSYLLAVRVAQPAPHGMFISTEPAHTMRPHLADGGDLFLVGGEGHKVGQGGNTVTRYQRIEQLARQRFAVQSVEYRWSTQDNKTLDRVPYIGRATRLRRSL